MNYSPPSRSTVAWSYSRLKTYELCPKKYEAIHVKKSVKDTDSAASTEGKRVHEVFQKYLTGKLNEFPAHLAWAKPLADKVMEGDGDLYAEYQMAVSADLYPCPWFGHDVWVRAIADVLKVGKDSAVLLDWKTGKVLDDKDQLDLTAWLAFCHFKNLERISAAFVYLGPKILVKQTYTREECAEKWTAFIPRARALRNSHDESQFPARPNGTCRKWCPVKVCPHNGG